MYDVAIIGSGPAGLSCALNLKLHNKSFIWFGSKQQSKKVELSEKIANYPGISFVKGTTLNEMFKNQAEEMGIEITDAMVSNIMKTRKGFTLLADNEIYDAKTILLAVGAVSAKGFENEERLLGYGVSYCATCDGFLYKGKTIGVYCGSKRYEHEIEYLAQLAQKVYCFAPYKEYDVHLDNVEKMNVYIKSIQGENKVEKVILTDGSELALDGLFVIRDAIAPSTLIKDLELDGISIKVNRQMETNKEGVYAAGDCTGRPYQIAKAVGEGNIAAHSIVEYLAAKEKENTK